MATIIYCGYDGCDWSYRSNIDETKQYIAMLFIHYMEKHDAPRPIWDFYKE